MSVIISKVDRNHVVRRTGTALQNVSLHLKETHLRRGGLESQQREPSAELNVIGLTELHSNQARGLTFPGTPGTPDDPNHFCKITR